MLWDPNVETTRYTCNVADESGHAFSLDMTEIRTE